MEACHCSNGFIGCVGRMSGGEEMSGRSEYSLNQLSNNSLVMGATDVRLASYILITFCQAGSLVSVRYYAGSWSSCGIDVREKVGFSVFLESYG